MIQTKPKNYLPVFIQSQRVLLLGGGEIAEHKYEILRQSGTLIKVIAKDIRPSLRTKLIDDQVQFELRAFNDKDINDADLIVSAINDGNKNHSLYQQAIEKNKLINCVDDVQYCNFIFPAMINQDGVMIAISTAGKSPLFASWLRSKILRSLPENFSNLASFIFKYRSYVKTKISQNSQVSFWHWLLNKIDNQSVIDIDHAIECYKKINSNQSVAELTSKLTPKLTPNRFQGKVYLIGSGPGSAEQLTLKAARLLASAEVVFYDGLVTEDVLNHIRKEAIKIDVSKRCGSKKISQDQINQLLVEYAKKFSTVIRLKSGDPLIFSRGSEELEALKNDGIEAEIIPGISAFQAAAANHQFAITHRDYAKGLELHSLHDLKNKDDHYFARLIDSKNTLAFYMASEQLDFLIAKMQKIGAKEDLAISLICNISRANEQIFVGKLSNIKEKLPTVIPKPCLIVMGETIEQNLTETANAYSPITAVGLSDFELSDLPNQDFFMPAEKLSNPANELKEQLVKVAR